MISQIIMISMCLISIFLHGASSYVQKLEMPNHTFEPKILIRQVYKHFCILPSSLPVVYYQIDEQKHM